MASRFTKIPLQFAESVILFADIAHPPFDALSNLRSALAEEFVNAQTVQSLATLNPNNNITLFGEEQPALVLRDAGQGLSFGLYLDGVTVRWTVAQGAVYPGFDVMRRVIAKALNALPREATTAKISYRVLQPKEGFAVRDVLRDAWAPEATRGTRVHECIANYCIERDVDYRISVVDIEPGIFVGSDGGTLTRGEDPLDALTRVHDSMVSEFDRLLSDRIKADWGWVA